MKTILTILVITAIAALMSFGDPLKNSTGAEPGHTGSPGDGKNCTFCHGGSAQSISNVFTSNIPPSGYVPGETYTVTVTTSGTGRKGFQVSPQNFAGQLLGTLTAGNGNKLVGNNKYVTHSFGVTGATAQWSFQWTAPPAGTGNVVFYGAFVIGQPNVRLSTMQVQEDETIGIEEIDINPAYSLFLAGNNMIRINLSLSEAVPVLFTLVDLSGKIVTQKNFGMQQAGDFSDQIQFNTHASKSLYLGIVNVGNQRYSQKIIL